VARTAKQEDAYVRHIRACLETIPDAQLYVCEWHLRHALERLMGKLRTEQPQHHDAIDELLAGGCQFFRVS
jgi:hypothetical protein